VGHQSQTELQDLTAIHTFQVSLLEKHLEHRIPLPAQVESLPAEPESTEAVQPLKHWLGLLDMAITPPMIREALKCTDGPETAHSLLRYFVGKASAHSNDRDKTDCVITHLFRRPQPESPGRWHRPEVDASYYFMSQAAMAFETELYKALGEVQFDSVPPSHVQLLHEFEFFHQELEEFRHFDQVTDSNIVQRVRELKQSLGRSFYHPDSLATIAVWNDVFGRKFDDLFHDATKQIKVFAENVQREGGSIMSRVDGDITIKHLAEIETKQILTEDYQNAQDQFRKLSKYKKAVDSKRSGRVTPAPIPSRSISVPAPPQSQPQAASTPAQTAVQPVVMAQELNSAAANAGKAQPAPPLKMASKTPVQTEVLAVPPSQAVQNAVQEGKIHSARETIKNHVRTTEPKFVHIVNVKKSKITLTPAEVEAFKSDYQGEKSFRADYVNIMMTMVAYHSRMLVEVDEYNQKASSAYLWKPHADALSYLLSTLERVSLEAEQVKAVARTRGLHDKVSAVEVSLEKLKECGQNVSQTLHAADQSYSG